MGGLFQLFWRRGWGFPGIGPPPIFWPFMLGLRTVMSHCSCQPTAPPEQSLLRGPHSAGGVCFSQGHSLSRFQIDYILSMECVSLNKSSGEGEDHLLLGWVHLILWAGGRGPWSPLKCDCIHDHSLTGPKTRGKEAEHNLLKKKNGIAIEDTTKTC